MLTIECVYGQLLTGVEPFEHGRQLSSGIVKITAMGVSCVMTRRPLVAVGADHIAGIDLPQADAATNGSGDAAIGQLGALSIWP